MVVLTDHVGMQKSASIVDQLQRDRDEADRRQMALVYDLREKLDFANAAKRRCVCSFESSSMIQSPKLCELCQDVIQHRPGTSVDVTVLLSRRTTTLKASRCS